MATKGERRAPVRTLESGDIYFLYRPRVGEEDPLGLGDVQRLYMLLSPRGDRKQCMTHAGFAQ
ncbi:MAG: hypothetical protein HY900_11200 [Deltaproteobacteria bacterium]|nr:hypothetical protein [Deltaproteobacteria bacterium]